MNRTITNTLFALLTIVLAASAQEPERRPFEQLRMIIAGEGFNLELVMIDGQPASCRFEGRNMSFTELPGGGMTVRTEDGREIIRIVRDEIVAEVAEEARPVRLGLLVTPAPGIVCAQLGLDPGSAIAVTAVEPGLPAARAGLQKHDVIIGMNDGLGASEEKLAEVVKRLEPGGRLALHVRRGGRDRTIEILVEANDERKSGVPILTDIPLLGHLFQNRPIEGRIVDADGRVVAGVVKKAPDQGGDDPLAQYDRSRARYFDLLSRQAAAQQTKENDARLETIDRRLADLAAVRLKEQQTLETISRRINKEGVKDISASDENGSYVVITLHETGDEQTAAIKLQAIEKRLQNLETLLADLAKRLDR